MSLYTVAEICHKMLTLFVLKNDEGFLNHGETLKHIQLAEKFIFDIDDIKDELFPLEAIAKLFLEKNSPFVKKSQNPLHEKIYLIFTKLLSFYMLTNKLASAVKSEEGSYLLSMIFNELEYIREDIMANNFLAMENPALKSDLLNKTKDCLDRLSTIITLPEVPQDNQAFHFLSLTIEESSLSDIANVLNNVFLYVDADFLIKIKVQNNEKWFEIINNIYEQCSLEFYTHQQQVTSSSAAMKYIDKSDHLSTVLQLVQEKSSLLHKMIKLYVFVQYLLCQTDISATDERMNELEELIEDLVSEHRKGAKNIFDMDPHLLEEVIVKIQNIISNMKEHQVKLHPMKNILELSMGEIHLNDVMEALNHLLYEVIEQIRLTNDDEGQRILVLYDELLNTTIRNPLNLKEYLIPPRYHHEVMKSFKHNIVKLIKLNTEQTELIKKYPLITELLGFYYYVYSLSIDETTIHNTLIPLLLYCEFYDVIKNKHYHAIYANSSEYFKETMSTILHFLDYLCQYSTVSAFIIRAILLDFTVIATFAQGTREYYEAEDGLCAGYVNHIAEHILIDLKPNAKSDPRSLRWNIKHHKSPFEFSVNSPFQQVIANSRTFDYQEKPLAQVTSAIQMDYATSEFRFQNGEELAEKLLELLAEHPESVMRLGVWQIGVEIGHAVACFVKDNNLHFFCATHSWISIPYDEANPKFHAFLHSIFHDLNFFNQYNKFWIGVIYRTWEATPVDDKHFYYSRVGEDYPFAYSKEIREKLAQKALNCIDSKVQQRETMISKCLSISHF